MHTPIQARLNNNAGIAIGPILFVVAILAILATAIAAGSSTFASSSSQETNRTNAASMIQIGLNLKLGVDRLVALGTPLTNVVINSQNTVNSVDLFSPIGGGLVPPSVALASDPTTDQWYYTWGTVTNMGTTNLERLAILHVNQGVCDQINVQAGNTATPATTAMGNANNTVNFSAWPTTNVIAKMVGCVNDSSPGANTYYFYQVLAVQ